MAFSTVFHFTMCHSTQLPPVKTCSEIRIKNSPIGEAHQIKEPTLENLFKIVKSG